MDIDLHTDSPEPYVAEASPLDLAEAVQTLAEWDEPACRVADYLLNAWVLTACRRPDDRQGLDDLEYALHHALERAPASATLAGQWRARWGGYLDLLHARALLHGGDAEIRDLLSRKHVPEVLAQLGREGELPQSALRERLGLGHERLSQVLRQMEGRGLIARRRQGRENLVALTEAGRNRAPRQDSAPPRRAGRNALADPIGLDTILAA